jgi:NADH dehydrogenase/NADH:ubiquinone oxidoreductase subunit G
MTDELVSLILNGKTIQTKAGTTILSAARENGIEIPTICYHDHLTANALCRICVVEVEGARVLIPACVGKVSEGMKVSTHSERVTAVRKTILEMLASAVDLSDSPEIQPMLVEYAVREDRYPDSVRREKELIDDNPMYVREYSKCVLCWRCVQVCARDAQYTYAINFTSRGYDTSIGTFFDRPMPGTTCVFCGQCVGVCPTGALKSRREWMLEKGYSAEEINRTSSSDPRIGTDQSEMRPGGGAE